MGLSGGGKFKSRFRKFQISNFRFEISSKTKSETRSKSGDVNLGQNLAAKETA